MDTGSPDWGQQESFERRQWLEEYEADETHGDKQMSLIAKYVENTEFELAPEGAIVGRCYKVIDLGTHEDEKWQKTSHLVQISWELPGKLMRDGRPFSVSKRYTLSVHEKSRLRQDLESWYGRKFDEGQLKKAGGFDLKKLIGKAGLLNIMHSEDMKFANVASITPLPDGLQCPPAVNPPFVFDVDADWDGPKREQLSPKQREFIALCRELNPVTPESTGKRLIDDDSDIPFN